MTDRKNILFILSFAILLLFVIWNFYNVYINAVDVPYWDEWEALLPGRLDSRLNLDWIFSYHNEHKIVFTRLYTWILYHIDGWNLRHQIICNFFLFLTSMGLLYKIIPDKNCLLPLCFIPCFSDVNFENQLTGFQSQFYFMLIFAFSAIYFGFVKQKNIKNTILFAFFTICSIFSMTFVSGVALLTAYLIKERKLNKYSITAFLLILAGILLFFVNCEEIVNQTPITLPNSILFWEEYFKVIFHGIFNVYFSKFSSLLAGILTGLCAVYLFIKEKNNSDFYVYIALFCLSFFLMGAIACGRFTNNILCASSRHLSVINFLIPCIGALLYRYRQYKIYLLYLLILFCNFIHYYSFEQYDYIRECKERGKTILSIYINRDKEKIVIPDLHPSELKQPIERGKSLNISSFRKNYDEKL